MSELEMLFRIHPECKVHGFPSYAWQEYTGQGRSNQNLTREESARRILEVIKSHPTPARRRELVRELRRASGIPEWRLYKMICHA